MCQECTGSGDMAGHYHGPFTHKAYIYRKKVCQWLKPLPTFLIASFVVLLLTFASLLMLFHFSSWEDSMPNFLLPLTETPFCLWPWVVELYAYRDELFLEAVFPAIVNLQNK